MHRWRYATVRSELSRVSSELDKASSERRVALLTFPGLTQTSATDGLHAGIQMLLAGESAAAHRHSPAALRVGLEATDTITFVNDQEVPLGPLDVVLNPSGTWHGHTERGGTGAVWLDVVDLPLVNALGGVLFEPSRAHQTGDLLDPASIPPVSAFRWFDAERALFDAEAVAGVRSHSYGGGSVLPTLAVTAYALEPDAELRLPARTGGAIVLAAKGRFEASGQAAEQTRAVDEFDVIALRSWTPLTLRATDKVDIEPGGRSTGGIVMVIDTTPALRSLGLYREELTT